MDFLSGNGRQQGEKEVGRGKNREEKRSAEGGGKEAGRGKKEIGRGKEAERERGEKK